jgi:hypothetical protein
MNMDKAAASKEIKNIFSTYKKITSTDRQIVNGLNKGKLYELYVLSWVVSDLAKRGFILTFKGASLQFKGSPGKIKKSEPHFEIISPNRTAPSLYLFVDIEFETLGSKYVGVSDNSLRHEIDIVVVDVDSGYPTYKNIVFGVECKAVSNFSKSILKEVLGVRRELSLLDGQTKSLLSAQGGRPSVTVPADPPSEYWLAYIDPAGNFYRESPAAFGVEFKHMPV